MANLKIGDKLPLFALQNQDGDLINIAEFIGKPLVIYFYPKDDTPGCTKEACAFRDEYHRFAEEKVTVFGISEDSVASHKKFKLKYNLPFDLLFDENNKVRKEIGVPGDLFGFIPGRVTYIIDNQGIVKHLFNSQINPTKHVDEAIRILSTL